MYSYSYLCESCGGLFEFDATPEEMAKTLDVVCPLCESEKTVKTEKGFGGSSKSSGTYRYSKAMGRVVKVSDKVPGLGKGTGGAPSCSSGMCGL